LKFFVIGDEDTVLGFNLVGSEGLIVHDTGEARRALEEAVEQKDVGIIIITERIAAWIRPEVRAQFYTKTIPLIVEIPDRLGPVEGRVSIKEVIQTAVGIRME